MLPLKNRLRKKSDLQPVFSRGKLVRGPFLSLRILPGSSDPTRFAFVVSNKVSKKSVVRNAIRRKMREAVRLFLDEISAGHDIIVIAHPAIIDKTFHDIKTELNNKLATLGLRAHGKKK